MPSSSRRKRRITLAVLCCLPTLLLAAVWLVAAATPWLRPGRALPERSAVGLADGEFQVYTSSQAIDFEDLPPADQPPAPSGREPVAWGRHVNEATKLAGVIGLRRGVEWHGATATRFTLVAVPLWLPVLCTVPLLLVAARQVLRLRAAARLRREGVCPNCRHHLTPDDVRCPNCGRAVPSVDPVGQLFLAGGDAAGIHVETRKSK